MKEPDSAGKFPWVGVILIRPVDLLIFHSFFSWAMIHTDFLRHLIFTFFVSSLWGGLHGLCGTWLRCNSLPCIRENHTLHSAQLPESG